MRDRPTAGLALIDQILAQGDWVEKFFKLFLIRLSICL